VFAAIGVMMIPVQQTDATDKTNWFVASAVL
jgi:hypothetical protein